MRELIIEQNEDDEEETIITLEGVEVWRGRDIGTLELVTAVATSLGCEVVER